MRQKRTYSQADIIRFLNAHEGEKFTASQIKTETGVPKNLVGELLSGREDVALSKNKKGLTLYSIRKF